MQVVVDNRARRLTMPASAKSLVVDSDSKRRIVVEELLGNIGYTTAESCASFDELAGIKRSTGTNFILVVCTSTVTDALLQSLQHFLNKASMPVLMIAEEVSAKSMQQAMEAGVSSFLTLHIQGNRIQQAIDAAFANFTVIDGFRQEVVDLKIQLHDRVIIEKAKGLVIKNRQLDEKQAYGYLRDYSMKKSMKMVDVANMVIAAAELLDR